MSDELINDILTRIRLFEEDRLPAVPDLEELRGAIEGLLKREVELIPPDEYVRGERLVAYFLANREAVEPAQAQGHGKPVFALHVWVSWVSPYATIEWRSSEDGRE
ncbi:MAG: hypothetical protein ACM3JD_19540 [Rudaea sp.]